MTMKLAQGVDLHFMKTQQFKMTHLTMRFSGRINMPSLQLPYLLYA